MQPLHKKITQPIHKNTYATSSHTKITQPLHTQNHATSEQEKLCNLSTQKKIVQPHAFNRANRTPIFSKRGV